MKFSLKSKSLAKDIALAQTANNDTYTMDLSQWITPEFQNFIYKLKRVDVFARKNGLTTKQVYKLCEVNTIPCTIISGVPFIIDIGEDLIDMPSHPISQEAIRKFNEFSKKSNHGNAGKKPVGLGGKRPDKNKIPADYKDTRFLND